ncbi:hypothetical protein [Neiella marina]|uniref:hypothetical protein n=1 Tax=Neiella marina TaxID=508461 RepID=UPI000B3BF9C2|nr:hypothetical protein [Neiella marina]
MEPRISINHHVENLYPRLVLLDEILVSSRCTIPMLGLLRDMALLVGPDEQIEVYKAHYFADLPLPELCCISSPGVDDALLDALFDGFAQRIAALKL